MTELLPPAVRESLNHGLPVTITTVSEDGVPNVTYLSRVVCVDDRHVALSNQFFRKTRKNLDDNPVATLLVVSPRDGRQHRLVVELEERLTEGPLFDSLKAELESIASLTGMGEVFRLKSADVFLVLECERLSLVEESAGLCRKLRHSSVSFCAPGVQQYNPPW